MKNNNDDVWFWFYDEFIRQWVVLYFWPYFVAGNIDNWMSMGSLNGIKSSNLCKFG